MDKVSEAVGKAYEAGYSSSLYITLEVMLLDPLWWQALSKALRLLKYTRNDGCAADNPDIQEMPNQGWTESWKHYWHRFIDHLAEGGNTETFFTNLLQSHGTE